MEQHFIYNQFEMEKLSNYEFLLLIFVCETIKKLVNDDISTNIA